MSSGFNYILYKQPYLHHLIKTQYLLFRLHANYILSPWKNPEEISRRSMLFHN